MGIFGMIRGEISRRKKQYDDYSERRFMKEVEQLGKVEQEKAELEKREFARKTLAERKREVRELKRARFKEKVGKVKQGLQKVKQGLQKVKPKKSILQSNMGQSTGSRDIFGGGSRDVFSGESEKKKRIIF